MISVIMATYNGAEFIEKQMESIRNQTVLPDEVLFCDDNSCDNTVDIIKSYINHYKLSNWKVEINKNNLGYYMNFINGAHLTRGDTIYFADQDDIWNIHKIEFSEKLFIKDNNVMMVQTNYIFIDQDDNNLGIDANYHRIHTDEKIVKLSLSDMCKFSGSGFTMGFRKEVISYIYSKELYQVEEFHFHDILVGLVSACLGKCLYLPNVYDEHRLHLHNSTQKLGESVTAKRTKEIQISNFENRKEYFIIMRNTLLNNKNIKKSVEKVNALNRFINFNTIRINYYNSRKIKYFISLLNNIECYYDWKAIFGDILFAFNLSKIIQKYFKNYI